MIITSITSLYYKLTPIGVLIRNDTKQTFATCRELNDAKTLLINCKIYSLFSIINS